MTLDDLKPAALFRLDTSISELRHSVVKTAFYNLRIYAELLPEKWENPEFRAKLHTAAGGLKGVKEVLENFGEYPLQHSTTISDVLPERLEDITDALKVVQRLTLDEIPVGKTACQSLSDEILRSIDQVLLLVERLREVTDKRRLNLLEITGEVERFFDSASEEGVEFCLDVQSTPTGGFGDKRQLTDAVLELARNTRETAFTGHDGEKKIDLIVQSDSSDRGGKIIIRDNGIGMDEAHLKRLGTPEGSTRNGGDGIRKAKRIIEEEHFGRLEFRSEPGKGTEIEIWLPYRLEPDLEADTTPKPEPVTTGTPYASGQRSWPAAAMAFCSITAAGIGVAYIAWERGWDSETLRNAVGIENQESGIGNRRMGVSPVTQESGNGVQESGRATSEIAGPAPKEAETASPKSETTNKNSVAERSGVSDTPLTEPVSPHEKSTPTATAAAPASTGTGRNHQPSTINHLPVPAPGPNVITVAADGSGQFKSIQEAMKNADEGAVIEVKAGEYIGPIVMDKAVTIRGEGKRQVWVRTNKNPVVYSKTGKGRIENMKLSMEGDIKMAAVIIHGGELQLHDCDITSKGGAGIEVSSGNPKITECDIHDTAASGVIVADGAKGSYERLTVTRSAGAGITVSDQSEPQFKGIEITECKGSGLVVLYRAKGTYEKLKISQCGKAGISVAAGCDPIVFSCTIFENRGPGLEVLEKGKGTFESNKIIGNQEAGIVLHGSSDTRFSKNNIEGNGTYGLWKKPFARFTSTEDIFSRNAQPNFIEE